MQDNFNKAAQNPEEMGRELLAELNKSPQECDREKCLRLIRAGACLEEASTDPSNAGELPLHIALREGYDDIAMAMIEAGAKPDSRDDSGNTPLMCAAVYGRTALAEALIGRGVKLEETNSSGYTALIWAGYWGKKDVADLLIMNGAKTDARDHLGHTAHDWTVLNTSFSTPETGEAINGAIVKREDFEDWRAEGMPLKTPVTVSRPLTLKTRTA
ncbi:MAG: ankyrin repeat domain-containing protein [Alphaproteobacteria bacterium]